MVKIIWFCCQKNYSKWSHRHVESSFHKPANFFCQKAEFFSLISENDKNTKNFFKKLFFFQGFLWTRRSQFWQSCGKSFDKNQKFSLNKRKWKKYTFFPKNLFIIFLGSRRILCLTTEKKIARCPKTTERSFFLKHFSSNYIYRDVKCTFLEPAEKRLPANRIFSCQSPQKNWKLKYFSRKKIPSKFAYGYVEYTFDNLIGQTLIEGRFFFAQCPRKEKKLKTFSKQFFETVLVNMLNAVLAALLVFSTKGPNFFAQCPELKKIR